MAQTTVIRDGAVDGYHRHFGGIVQDTSGRMHLIYRRAAQHAWTDGATLFHCHSDDGGKSFSAEVELVAPIPGHDVRSVSLGVSPSGRVVAIYGATDGVVNIAATSLKLYVKHYDHNTETWSAGALIADIATGYGLTYGRIKVVPFGDGSRMLFTPYYRASVGPNVYKVACWYGDDNGENWTEGPPIFHSASAGYNETEAVAIDADNWLAVSRGSGLHVFLTTDAGGSWAYGGAIPTVDGVSPSMDKIVVEGVPSVLLGYCDRSPNTMVWKVAPARALLEDPTQWGAGVTVATDMENASGYQCPVVAGQLAQYVEFKEYGGQPYSQVRLVSAEVFDGFLFTPALYGASAPNSAPTYAAREGRFSYLSERLCIANFRIQIAAKGAMAGQLRIGSLPHNIKNVVAARTSLSIGYLSGLQLPAGTLSVQGLAFGGTNEIYLYRHSLTAIAGLLAAEVADNFTIYGTLIYEIDKGA